MTGRKGQSMKIEYSAEFSDYMKRKRKAYAVVAVAEAAHSDIEITEIFVRVCDEGHADYLKKKKRYREVADGDRRVLLPPYRLDYEETLRFFIRKQFIFKTLAVEGVRL